VRGSTIGGNVYLVDGVDSTDPVTATFGTNFVYNAIQEIQFQTGGFNAEFGRATGGIANIVTKSGGNAFSGSFDARYRTRTSTSRATISTRTKTTSSTRSSRAPSAARSSRTRSGSSRGR
jgi:hypothetical protein